MKKERIKYLSVAVIALILTNTYSFSYSSSCSLSRSVFLSSSSSLSKCLATKDDDFQDDTNSSNGSASSLDDEPLMRSATLSIDSSSSSSSGADGSESYSTRNSNKRENFLEGRWESIHGNYILRPPISSNDGQPKALIHFLGGAFVGASPHLAYRYVLEKLSERGYVIVATPYKLTFDHLATCDEIISRFERCAPGLARMYGAVPVVGLGHSCGSLLQVLISALFPDTPRAANILISYNNKPISDAVPFFSEVVTPLAATLANPQNATVIEDSDEGQAWNPPSVVDTLNLGLKLAKASTEGDRLPSDQLLNEVVTTFLPPSARIIPETTGTVSLPTNVRDSLQKLVQPTADALDDSGVLPTFSQLLEVADQVPSLLQEVADGVEDFIPSPASTASVAKKAYRARSTLLVKFENDSIDETEELETLLNEAERIMRMKKPMISMGVDLRTLKGNHATPILAPPLQLASRAEEILGPNDAKERLLYKEADDIVETVVEWLEGLVNG